MKVRKKIKEFDTIGYCEYYLDGELLGKVELYSDRDMKKKAELLIVLNSRLRISLMVKRKIK